MPLKLNRSSHRQHDMQSSSSNVLLDAETAMHTSSDNLVPAAAVTRRPTTKVLKAGLNDLMLGLSRHRVSSHHHQDLMDESGGSSCGNYDDDDSSNGEGGQAVCGGGGDNLFASSILAETISPSKPPRCRNSEALPLDNDDDGARKINDIPALQQSEPAMQLVFGTNGQVAALKSSKHLEMPLPPKPVESPTTVPSVTAETNLDKPKQSKRRSSGKGRRPSSDVIQIEDNDDDDDDDDTRKINDIPAMTQSEPAMQLVFGTNGQVAALKSSKHCEMPPVPMELPVAVPAAAVVETNLDKPKETKRRSSGKGRRPTSSDGIKTVRRPFAKSDPSMQLLHDDNDDCDNLHIDASNNATASQVHAIIIEQLALEVPKKKKILVHIKGVKPGGAPATSGLATLSHKSPTKPIAPIAPPTESKRDYLSKLSSTPVVSPVKHKKGAGQGDTLTSPAAVAAAPTTSTAPLLRHPPARSRSFDGQASDSNLMLAERRHLHHHHHSRSTSKDDSVDVLIVSQMGYDAAAAVAPLSPSTEASQPQQRRRTSGKKKKPSSHHVVVDHKDPVRWVGDVAAGGGGSTNNDGSNSARPHLELCFSDPS